MCRKQMPLYALLPQPSRLKLPPFPPPCVASPLRCRGGPEMGGRTEGTANGAVDSGKMIDSGVEVVDNQRRAGGLRKKMEEASGRIPRRAGRTEPTGSHPEEERRVKTSRP